MTVSIQVRRASSGCTLRNKRAALFAAGGHCELFVAFLPGLRLIPRFWADAVAVNGWRRRGKRCGCRLGDLALLLAGICYS